ncbi:peptidoglycan bridge formation glycyltransferase FemA/FemB family protein [Nocardioides mangrovicus]|uniref:Peptidoglycan bridge formation glycyltransferase FemA/FemB family protein n=1 Tax=Nocardioides mangrovicus TaxID=2478913 RepID=A0A3L8NY90_9ACTN|nr:peptidoglycan bridge formation glycyltransferase FemA/FemB family protein [Nocardioides mangrovicus]RLV48110.1 peptidoglycan bridge formation glycyltransferase FemA/FemB family protein [Nocardioides mangrovicus]
MPSTTHPGVRVIDAETHLGFVRERGASFLQTPAWALVKPEWGSLSLGWYAGEELIGVGLVLLRRLPRLKRYLAYLPEGPVLDWSSDDLPALLNPMTEELRRRGAFGVRIGPPVACRRWSAQQVKDGIADAGVGSLTELAPTEREVVGARVVSTLREQGWRQLGGTGGFTAGQPQFNFMLPLAGRGEDDVLAGMNQLWRRNIKKAAKAGVEVAPDCDVADFHRLYAETAARDGFTPRPLSYFRTMVAALGAEDPERIRLWAARHEGDLVAATLSVRVGAHYWYSYGASSSHKREVRGSNAVQWAMIRDALAGGCEVYDLRGITDTLDPADPHAGLVQFKVGTGGEAVEYAGEWDLPLNRALYAGFSAYMRRR